MPAWLSHSFDLKSTRPSTKALCSNSLSLAFFSSTQKEYYSWGCLALEASKRCWHNGPFCFSTKIIEFLHENKSTIVFNRVLKFMYSEKATKIWGNLQVDSHKRQIHLSTHILVAFSEYMNFTMVWESVLKASRRDCCSIRPTFELFLRDKTYKSKLEI